MRYLPRPDVDVEEDRTARAPADVYVCGTYRTRPGSCSHNLGVPAAELHAAVLDNVKKYLAGPMIVSHLLAQMEAPVKRDGTLPRSTRRSPL